LAEPCDLGDLRDLCDLPPDRLADMADAGGQIRECYRLLRKGGGNIVGEVLRGHGAFFDWEHYPPGDVYDDETHSQYYYHAHPGACRFAEHGHFHTFLRPLGMPAGIVPAAAADGGAGAADGFADNQALSHLVAISMDEAGYPVRLFRPEVEALIRERDAVLAASAAAGGGPIHEDQALEVVSSLAISVEQQVENVARALASRERR
jgi:hypothetical protein